VIEQHLHHGAVSGLDRDRDLSPRVGLLDQLFMQVRQPGCAMREVALTHTSSHSIERANAVALRYPVPTNYCTFVDHRAVEQTLLAPDPRAPEGVDHAKCPSRPGNCSVGCYACQPSCVRSPYEPRDFLYCAGKTPAFAMKVVVRSPKCVLTSRVEDRQEQVCVGETDRALIRWLMWGGPTGLRLPLRPERSEHLLSC
jgi:hypothetical protein